MALISRNTWDNVVIVTRDGTDDQTWDGKVKNLIYDVGTLSWIAETASSGGGGGGGDASAANQVTGNNSLALIESKTPEIDYATQIDDSVSGTTYVGYALVGTPTDNGQWKIKKIEELSGITSITYAEGNADFNKTWDDRESYSYS